MRTGLESVIPDNARFSINMHYQSDTTHEFGTLRLTKAMNADHVLAQYTTLFPIESAAFLGELKTINQNLHRPGGMSQAGIIMAIGRVPKLIFMAMEFLDVDYWTDLRKFRKFIRTYPKFAVGDHSRKTTNPGVLIK